MNEEGRYDTLRTIVEARGLRIRRCFFKRFSSQSCGMNEYDSNSASFEHRYLKSITCFANTFAPKMNDKSRTILKRFCRNGDPQPLHAKFANCSPEKYNNLAITETTGKHNI